MVREGALRYVLADAPNHSTLVEAGDHAVIEPNVEHWVEIVGAVSFVIEFYRDDAMSRPLHNDQAAED